MTLDDRDREDTKILIYELEKSDYVIPDKYKKYITETDYYNMYETREESSTVANTTIDSVFANVEDKNAVNLFVRRSFSQHLCSWINDSASRL